MYIWKECETSHENEPRTGQLEEAQLLRMNESPFIFQQTRQAILFIQQSQLFCAEGHGALNPYAWVWLPDSSAVIFSSIFLIYHEFKVVLRI